MSLWNFLKKKGRRIAGTYGRINHKKHMRAASKGIRRFKTDQEKQYTDITEEILEMYANDPDRPTVEELLECDETPECEHRHTEYHRYFPATQETPEEPEGYYCLDCDTWLGMPDEATLRGI